MACRGAHPRHRPARPAATPRPAATARQHGLPGARRPPSRAPAPRTPTHPPAWPTDWTATTSSMPGPHPRRPARAAAHAATFHRAADHWAAAPSAQDRRVAMPHAHAPHPGPRACSPVRAAHAATRAPPPCPRHTAWAPAIGRPAAACGPEWAGPASAAAPNATGSRYSAQCAATGRRARAGRPSRARDRPPRASALPARWSARSGAGSPPHSGSPESRAGN